ncbi:hypothetical protein SISNIDRAFT_451020 [Sistotremastrum niveocremeum HHB9708]|uniref:ZZ-type domain-containing protein n=1 Tax=Sistotremastrum niveocremeum HHB9708 TaxID=1314777 RepID=A0A164XW17_9AGAM|nr:hypothetical protein SISNIDRAFT_451020 [Sistotremastrum niveocremeum HHB9708]
MPFAPSKKLRDPSKLANDIIGKGTSDADDKLDALDDAVQLGVGSFNKVKGFVTNNPAIFNEASSALASVLKGDLANTPIMDILRPVADVLKVVDVLASAHPILQAAVIPFKLVLEVELIRRHNDAKIPALLLSMADMMHVTFSLRDHPYQDVVDDQGNHMISHLENTLKKIGKSLQDCGRDLAAYRKQKTIVKFFKVLSWKAVLEGHSAAFADHKKALITSLSIDTSVKTAQNFALSIDIKNVVDNIFKVLTENEKKFKSLSDNAGPVEAIIENKTTWTKLQKIASDEDTQSGATEANAKTSVRAATKDKAERPNEKEDIKHQEDIEILFAIRADLKDLLLEDQKVFQQKWERREALEIEQYEENRKRLEELQATLQEARDEILDTVKAGPWQKVQDPIIKEIWQNAGWMSSVKNRNFVLTLHDHYADKNIPTDPHHHLINAAPAAEDTDQSGDTVNDDEWCLDFLDLEHASSIAQAIDLDGSGFIRIREVNEFVAGKPSSWSTLEWIAYTAAGVAIEVQVYRLRIMALLQQMITLDGVKPVNTILTTEYIDNHLTEIFQIMGQNALEINYEFYENSRLCHLVLERMKLREEALAKSLGTLRYHIDEVDTLYLVSRTAGHKENLEQFILPLLFLVLSRHLDIMKLAKTHTIHGKELELAGAANATIVRAWADRVFDLNKVFKGQQFSDVETKFATFAGGMFQPLYQINFKNVDCAVSDDFLLNDVTIPSIFWDMDTNRPEPTVDMLIHEAYTDDMQARDDKERQYVMYTRQSIMYSHYHVWNDRTSEQWDEYYALDAEVTEEQSEHLWQIADLQVRQEQAHYIYCDRCDTGYQSYIHGARYKCMQCPNFDLCESCESSSFITGTHLRSHNMLRAPWSVSRATARHRIKQGWQRLIPVEENNEVVEEHEENEEENEESEGAAVNEGGDVEVDGANANETEADAEPDATAVAEEVEEDASVASPKEDPDVAAPVPPEPADATTPALDESPVIVDNAPLEEEVHEEQEQEPEPEPEQPTTPRTWKCFGVCGRDHVPNTRFECLDCNDFQFCLDCWKDDIDESTGHFSTHTLIKVNSGSQDKVACNKCGAWPVKGPWLSCMECYQCDFCEGCEDWVADSHHPKHTLLKVPFPLPVDVLRKHFDRALELVRNTELGPPEFTPSTNTITGDLQHEDETANEPETKSEHSPDEDDIKEAMIAANAEEQPAAVDAPIEPAPLVCHGECGVSPIRGEYFRCVECPDFVMCANCEKQDPRQGSTHLAEHILVWIKRGKRELEEEEAVVEQTEAAQEEAQAQETKGVEDRLKDLEARLLSMEALLSRMAEKMGVV